MLADTSHSRSRGTSRGRGGRGADGGRGHEGCRLGGGEAAASLSLKEAADLSGLTEKVIRHELAAQVVRAGRNSAGARRFFPRELLYFCLVAELPIELPRKDRREPFEILARGGTRRGRWRREAQRLVLEGEPVFEGTRIAVRFVGGRAPHQGRLETFL